MRDVVRSLGTPGRGKRLGMPDTLTIESGPVGATDAAAGTDPTKPLHIPGHVDPSTGNVDAPGDVYVAGNVVDLHTLTAAGSVTVGGVIEAATVTAGTDLTAA